MESFVKEILTELPKVKSAKVFFINPSIEQSELTDSYSVAMLNINDSVVNVIKETIKTVCEPLVEKEKISVKDVDKEDDDYVLTVPLNEVENLNQYIKMINTDEYKSFNAHESEEFLAKLKYYIIQVKINSKQYFFIKRYSVTKLLAPKKFLIVCKENTYEYMSNEKIFMLENDFDAIICADEVYLIHEKQFSMMTGYYEVERNRANEVLNEFEPLAKSFINDFDKLREACEGKISYLKRLSKVDSVLLSKVTFANVAKLQKDRGTDFIVDKKNKTISFENESQLKNLIDVLLDNFMVSALTGEPYRAINKRKDKKAV